MVVTVSRVLVVDIGSREREVALKLLGMYSP